MNPTITLRALSKLLPKIVQQLDSNDYKALCKRLMDISNDISSNKTGDAELKLDKTIKRLEVKMPGLISHVRGVMSDSYETDTVTSFDKAKQVSNEIYDKTRLQLAKIQNQQEEKETAWFGLPEMYVFDLLSSDMRKSAIKIRDWCEDKLEFIHSRGAFRYFTAHGIGHSKRVLRYGIDLLNAFPQCFKDPFAYFAIYAGAYCHDIGMIYREGEDPECEKTVELIRKTHGRRAWEMILGNREQGFVPQWPSMGFASEREAMVVANICAVHQKSSEQTLHQLPKSQPLFFGGNTININPFMLAIILRLADALDCNERRLPPTAYMKHREIPEYSIINYVKHEIIEDVFVGKEADVHIAMRFRYIYPQGDILKDAVFNEISSEFSSVSALLKQCNLTLPSPQFNAVEALFLEKHPYLIDNNKKVH